MSTLIIRHPEKTETLSFEAPRLLSDLLPDLVKPCGGKGVCGKCRVRVAGEVSTLSAEERKVFSTDELADGWRLACRTFAEGDCEVCLSEKRDLKNIAVGGRFPAYAFDPIKGKYGLSVDIGTTTLAMRLSDLSTGKTLGEVSRANPQGVVAADVIGRIESALAGGLERLKTLISDVLTDMEEKVCSSAAIRTEDIAARVVTGNTTMLYLLTGRDPFPLSRAPFIADCLFGHWDGKTYYPPCMSAFVGADISCAALAAEMTEKDETALLMDIGTNGEVVLKHKNKFYCCSTAAGPAFEGGGISRGTGSIPGAIDSVRFENGKLVVTTIGAQPAAGICGSGVLDAVTALLDAEMLDETGSLDDDEVLLAGDVAITQDDIRKVQLAKGAIAAGVKTLVEDAGITFADIDTLYIAGGFGQHLNGESAKKIGLIPAELTGRAVVLGNAALTGATVHLLSRNTFGLCKKIAEECRTVPLAGRSEFSENYMECMMLEPLE